MQTPLFCLPSERVACYTNHSDNFSLTDNLDRTVPNDSFIKRYMCVGVCVFRLHTNPNSNVGNEIKIEGSTFTVQSISLLTHFLRQRFF